MNIPTTLESRPPTPPINGNAFLGTIIELLLILVKQVTLYVFNAFTLIIPSILLYIIGSYFTQRYGIQPISFYMIWIGSLAIVTIKEELR